MDRKQSSSVERRVPEGGQVGRNDDVRIQIDRSVDIRDNVRNQEPGIGRGRIRPIGGCKEVFQKLPVFSGDFVPKERVVPSVKL